MDYLRFIIKLIPITASIANLIGAIILYRSVKPSQSNLEGLYGDKGMEIYPKALLDTRLAKKGIGWIIFGFSIQLLAVFLV